VPAAQHRFVSPGYLAAMGIALRAGREPSLDEARPVAVVDETLARRHWPHPEDAVGAHLRIDRGTGPARDVEIVGVGRDGAPRLARRAADRDPLRAAGAGAGGDGGGSPAGNLSVVARLEPMGGAGAEAVRVALRAVDPEVPASTVRPLSASLAAALAPDRFQLGLLGGFGAAALLLAAPRGARPGRARGRRPAARDRHPPRPRRLGPAPGRAGGRRDLAARRRRRPARRRRDACALALERRRAPRRRIRRGAAALLLLIVAVAASLPASLAASRVDPIVALRA
jgi:hypothetical protein